MMTAVGIGFGVWRAKAFVVDETVEGNEADAKLGLKEMAANECLVCSTRAEIEQVEKESGSNGRYLHRPTSICGHGERHLKRLEANPNAGRARPTTLCMPRLVPCCLCGH
jgi:hypothetical protein